MKRITIQRGGLRLPWPVMAGLATGMAFGLMGGPVIGPATAVMYQWTTPEGVIGLTDDPGRIPEQYRATAKPYGNAAPAPAPKQTPTPTAKPQPIPATAAPESPAPAVDNNGHGRDWWQARVQELRDQRADLVRQQAEAEKKFNEIHYFGRETYGELQLAQTLRQRADDLGKQIDAVDQQLTSGLANEARQAGAPVGWVRD